MPELPDLNVFSHNLEKVLLHKQLEQITVVVKKKLRTPEEALKAALEGQRLESIHRVGKELHFTFKNGHVLGMHLMLHGKLYLFDEKNEQKHTICTLLFKGGKGLALTDYQGQANITLDPAEKEAPDALSREMSEGWLKETLAKKRTAIKKFLTDQHNILGIGNAYADDILWEARISPFSVSNKIPATAVKALHKAIHKVLTTAEKNIREHHPDIINGEVRDYMLVHSHKLTESPGGAAIQHVSAGGKTYYTDEQAEYK
ncbi:DNA-formamidopyrimidine glycosylase family protein [Chitinophaga qingshengii]|uniref:Fpg/Nei family DNA glycosylase n=1 Tax=Chitinophaga qingshengii TaxID=1569794 RepID=A0ABR7TS09_9BACT|nr:DNA-formamidopyrimidine glycosylase family protein [Chitinophaga qingshengii]MBC9932368.1 Fpg/Nei family DNA glycosylase [Chitinophaga qingshengii]